MTAGTAIRASLSVPGHPDQVRAARAFTTKALGHDHPCAPVAALLVSELVTNSVLFCLLSSYVAIAAIDGQVNLRPALSDYLFLAAACCGTRETGQPPSSAGQLRHGCHRTRRLRKESLHSDSRLPGGTVTVTVTVTADLARVEVRDAGGTSIPFLKAADDGAAEGGHGLRLVDYLAARWAYRRDAAGLTTWFEVCAEPPS